MQFLNSYPSQKYPTLDQHPFQYLLITDAKVDNHPRTTQSPLKHLRTPPQSSLSTSDPLLSLLHYYSAHQAPKFLQLLLQTLHSD